MGNSGISFLSHADVKSYSKDRMAVNQNGAQLLSLCKSLDFKIVNGRLGADKYIGNPTCFKSDTCSVVDYVIVSDDMLPCISDFNIDIFDPCISDVHSPIEFEIMIDKDVRQKTIENTIYDEEYDNNHSNTTEFKFLWNQEIATRYQSAITDIQYKDLFRK